MTPPVNEPTAPDFLLCRDLLNRLYDLSNALLEMPPDTEMTQLADVMAQRGMVLERLAVLDGAIWDDSQRGWITDRVADIQAVENRITEQLEASLAGTSNKLQQLRHNQQALSAYRFPNVSYSSGIEGQG
jgi:hypothetical protein